MGQIIIQEVAGPRIVIAADETQPAITIQSQPSATIIIAAEGVQGASGVYVQQTRPTDAGPWQWWVTDAGGTIIDLIVNDGA